MASVGCRLCVCARADERVIDDDRPRKGFFFAAIYFIKYNIIILLYTPYPYYV